MNFCLKNHFFTRDISSILLFANNTVMIRFKPDSIFSSEHIIFDSNEVTRITNSLPIHQLKVNNV